MAIHYNCTLIVCSHPKCKEFLVFQGPRVGSNLIEMEMHKHGWQEEAFNGGSNGRHYCRKHIPKIVQAQG
jgi:hypothetical protein